MIVPSDSDNAMLLKEGQSRSAIGMRFDTIICEKATVPDGVQSFTWDLGNKATPEVPIYIIVAFHTYELNSQTANPAVFDHCDVRDIMVEYNNERYPYTPYDLDFASLCYGRMYKEATKFSVKYYGMDELMAHSGISFTEYARVFPFVVSAGGWHKQTMPYCLRNYPRRAGPQHVFIRSSSRRRMQSPQV